MTSTTTSMEEVSSSQPIEEGGLAKSECLEDSEVTFPEGGSQAWRTVLGAWLVQYAGFGAGQATPMPLVFIKVLAALHMGTISLTHVPRLDLYVRDYLDHYSPSTIGWVGGVQICLILTAGIVTGRLFDRGYFHHLMISGSLLHCFSFFMLSLSHRNKYYQVFLSQGLGGGISVGLLYIPTLAVISHYFKHNRPLATGIVTSGTALGAVLHPIMLNHFFEGPLGFHNGVRVATAINSVILLVANLLMRTRLPPTTKETTIPIAGFFREPAYIFVVIGGMLIITGFSFPVFFLQLYGNLHGLDRKFSIYLLSILNACSIVGRILPSSLAPRLGVINLVIFFTFSMAVLEYFLLLTKDVGGFVAFAVVYGFFSGASIALTPAMLASLAKDVDEIGARIGVSFALSGIIGLFANTIVGALLTSHFHWLRPIVFAGTTVLAGGLSYLIARIILVRTRKTQVV